MDLRRRVRSLVALGVLVALGAGAVMATTAGARRGMSAMDRLLAVTQPVTAMVQPNQQNFDWDAVRRLPGVAAVGSFLLADITLEGYPEAAVTLPSTDVEFMSSLETAVVLAGRLPDETRPDEATAPEPFLAETGLALGDQVVAKLPDGARQPLRIVGVVRTPIMLNFTELITTRAFAVKHHAALMQNSGGVNNAVVRLSDGEAGLPAFQRDFARLTGQDDIEINNMAAMNAKHAKAGDFEGTVLLGMALAALAASMVLISQAVVRYAAASTEDLAVLRVLGLTPRQALTATVTGPALAAIAGVALGAGAAVAVSPLFPIGSAQEVEPYPGVSVDGVVLAAVAVLMVVLVTLSAGLAVVARRAGRGRASAVAKAADRLGLPTPVVLGIRLALEPGRGGTAVPVRPALAGAIVGVLGVLAAFTFRAGAVDAAGDPARFGQTFQLMGWIGAGGEDFNPRPPAEWSRDPDVRAINDTRVGVISTRSASVPVFTHEQPFPVVVLSGRMPGAPGEIALAPDSARQIGAKIGDLLPVKGRATGSLQVTGIAFVPEGPHNGYAVGGWLTGDGFQRLFPDGYFKFHFSLFALRPGADLAKWTAAGLEPAAVPMQVKQIGNILVPPLALGGFLALLAIAANGHALATAIRRRRQDVAVLRALGFTRAQCRLAVVTQATTLAVIGLLVGMPLGIALGRSLWRVVADLTPLLYVPPLALFAVLLAAPVALAVNNLLAAPAARRAARFPLATQLRSE